MEQVPINWSGAPASMGCMMVMKTVNPVDSPSRITGFRIGITFPLRAGGPEVDRSGDHNPLRLRSIGVVHNTCENFEVWGFTFLSHRRWIGLIFPLYVGGSEVAGAGDHKLIKCPSIGVLHDAREHVEVWGFSVSGHRF